MNEVLLIWLSLSLSGSILALILMAIKSFTKNRFSQTWQYYIWLIVILRLLLPFTPEISAVSEAARYIQNINEIPAAAAADQGMNDEANGGHIIQPAPNDTSIPDASQMIGADQKTPTPSLHWRDIVDYAWLLWLGVALVLFVHNIASYRSFVRFVKVGVKKVAEQRITDIYTEVCTEKNVKRKLPIYTNEQVASPMLVGIFHPMVVIPPLDAGDDELRNIFRHELTHYNRHDFIYKWIVQITLCLHWFNPLVYLVGKQINKSCELSCDETVIKHLDKDSRISYGDALLTSLEAQGSYSDFVVSITMSENATLVKERLDAIMKFGKQKKWVAALSVILAAALFIGGYVLGAHRASFNADIPEESGQGLSNDEYLLTVIDADKNDISKEIIRLWYNANEIYNVDDIQMFETGDSTFLFDNGPEFYEIMNYDQEVDAVFTGNGKAQLEQTKIGGPHTLIQKRDGKVYRMGAWKTGYSYADALEGIKVKQVFDDMLVLEVKFKEPIKPDDLPVYGYADFTVRKINDAWFVEDYVYPEANRNEAEEPNELIGIKPEILPVLRELIAAYENGDIKGVDYGEIPEYCYLPTVEGAEDFTLGENEMGLWATIPIDGEWQMDVLISNFDGVYRASGAGFNIIPGSFMDQAMARGLSFTQVRALIVSSFSEEDILTRPVEELRRVFAQLEATNNVDDRGFVTLNYTELINMADSGSAFVYPGDSFLGWTVVQAETVGIPYPPYVMEAESLTAVLQGQATFTGSLRREGNTVIIIVAEESSTLMPTSTMSPSKEIRISNAEEAVDIIASIIDGEPVQITISDYAIFYTCKLSFDANGDPLAEDPHLTQQAKLVSLN